MSIQNLNSLLSHNVKGQTENLLIVDTRPFSDYLKGHIPSAINLDLMQFHWLDTSITGIKQFNRQSRFLLSNLGIQNKEKVIFYDDTSGPTAARGLWLLLYFSYKEVAILDGGFSKWKEEGFKIEKVTNQFQYSRFQGKVNSDVLATSKEINLVIGSKKNSKAYIIDSRSEKEFDGTVVRGGRRGHIPKAHHIDWSMNLANGYFKNYNELARVYSDFPKDKQIIAYCQGGYRAANTFLALKLLGYKKVKVYLGSWGEWSSLQNLPPER